MTTRTDVYRVDGVPPDLREQIDATSRAVFPNVDGNGVDENGIEWINGDWCVIAWNGDTWGGYAEIGRREIQVGGKTITVGTVGGVMTHPDMRGIGLGKAVMRHVADVICRDLKADAGMLFCAKETIPYYESVGWYELQRKITYHQSDGERVMDTRGHMDGYSMFRPCREFMFPFGAIDVGGKLW
ncbi:MAG: GNAT family N-acetyltransferase [Chloroflexota bacterium]